MSSGNNLLFHNFTRWKKVRNATRIWLPSWEQIEKNLLFLTKVQSLRTFREMSQFVVKKSLAMKFRWKFSMVFFKSPRGWEKFNSLQWCREKHIYKVNGEVEVDQFINWKIFVILSMFNELISIALNHCQTRQHGTTIVWTFW